MFFPDSFKAMHEAPLPDRWWKDFEDPALSALIDEALAGNFGLKTAWSRLAEAEAVADKAGAGFWPSLSLEGSVRRSRTFLSFANRTFNTTDYDLSAGASYELDVWGKIRHLKGAAEAEFSASRDDLETIAMSLAAQVAETWFGLLAERSKRTLLEEQLETNRAFLELIDLRFQQGLATALDVYQQRQQVASTRAQLEQVEAQRQVMEHQLSILVGQPPQEKVSRSGALLPQLPELPGTGVPALLLDRRPDLRASRRRVEAADNRVGVAIADMFPALRLTASIGYGNDVLKNLFQELTWSIVGSITQPLFEGGKRLHEIDRSKAALEAQVNSYGEAVLNALGEVEDALVQEEHQLKHLKHLDEQLDHAKNALREAKERYVQGLTDFLRVLTALQALQGLEQNRIAAHRRLLSFRIQLCRALGGTWTEGLVKADEAEEEAQAEGAIKDEGSEQVSPEQVGDRVDAQESAS